MFDKSINETNPLPMGKMTWHQYAEKKPAENLTIVVRFHNDGAKEPLGLLFAGKYQGGCLLGDNFPEGKLPLPATFEWIELPD